MVAIPWEEGAPLHRWCPAAAVGLLLVLAAACSRPQPSKSPGPTASLEPSQADVVLFMVTASEATIPITDAGDCSAIGDAWLEAWCRDLVAYTPGDVPTTIERTNLGLNQPLIQLIYASLTWSLLHGDDTICDNPLVAAFLSFSAVAPGPSPTPSVTPSQRCRDLLAATLAEAQGDGGTFQVWSQITDVSVRVGLADGQALPMPAAR
jgi:hypothetical protein